MAAELGHVGVGDTGRRPLDGQRIVVEVRMAARAWPAAHVGDLRDAGVAQERRERLERMRRVPDREEPHYEASASAVRRSPNSAATSTRTSSIACLAGERNESAKVRATMRRIGGRAPSERTTMSSRTLISARSGMNDTPMPAATKPWIAL